MANRLRYFLPDWEDKVDPNFVFQTDTFSPDRKVSEDVYAHDIFQTHQPYDGILMSRAILEKTKKYEAIKKLGAHRYLRLPEGLEVFGDCGAFSYINEDTPPYKTEDVLEYYQAIGVDCGASVDHIALDSIYVTESVEEKQEDGTVTRKPVKRKVLLSETERENRRQITLENAREFIKLHNKEGYQFEAVGVAQGWTPDKYADSVKQLLQMGYTYIALGSLARSLESQIINVLESVKQTVDEFSNSPQQIRLHLFGVAKLSLVDKLPNYGVASIDSTSHLRRAWLKSGQNYLGKDGQWYTAIRVPQSNNPKVREYVSKNGKSMDEVQRQEKRCLEMLERYDKGELAEAELDQLLDAIVEYDNYLLRIGNDGQKLRETYVSRKKYQRTLEDKPWNNCPCEVCQQLGIHVIIFRGLNRNRRRGFHNTWTFYQGLKSIAVEQNTEG